MTARRFVMMLAILAMGAIATPEVTPARETLAVAADQMDIQAETSATSYGNSFVQSRALGLHVASTSPPDAQQVSVGRDADAGYLHYVIRTSTSDGTSISMLDVALMLLFTGALLAYPLVRRQRALSQSSVLSS